MLPAQSSLSTPHPLLYCLGELLLLGVSANLSLKTATNTLLRIFCRTKFKNYLLAGTASTETGRLCQQHSAGYARVAVGEVGIFVEEKNSGDKAHELDSQLLLSV